MIAPMSSKFAQVRSDALELSAEERARLGEELLESLAETPPPELSPVWKAEISRRLKSIEDGTAVLLDGDDALKRLMAKYEG